MSGDQVTANDRILDPDEAGPLKEGIDAILANLNDENKLDYFWATAVDKRLKFRYPSKASDLRNFEREGFQFLIRIRDGKRDKSLPEPYLEALAIREMDDEDLATAFGLHYWSYPKGGWHISELAALQFVAKAPGATYRLFEAVDRKLRGGAYIFAFEGYPEAKKESSPSPTTDSGSKPPESTSTSTQTP